MSIQHGLQRLAENGLNLFSSIPVQDLPAELRQFLPAKEFDSYFLCMLGHGGRRLWECLPHPLRAEEHPIDNFTLEQVDWFTREILRDKDAVLAFPRADWVLPLQRLGRFLNLARPSLVGLDINPEFGVWFAYRAVFLTRVPIPRIVGATFDSHCTTCVEKPCMRACPAAAVTEEKFELKSCAGYRLQGESRCSDRCLAREACPIQSQHRYSREQIRYHMARTALQITSPTPKI